MTPEEKRKFLDINKERGELRKAVVKANRNFGKTFKKGDTTASLKWAAGWNKCYAREMERLVTVVGIKN